MSTLSLFWKKISSQEFDAVPPLVDSKYLPSLDGLRAISIGIVIICHLIYSTPLARYASNGYSGVCIFFVISGFLITTLLLKEKIASRDISLKKFYARRFLRIFPVAYLYLFVLIFLNIIFQLHISGISFLTACLYVKNLTFLDGGEWQTGHFWSLAVEEQFYLIFPFILKYSFKRYVQLIIALIICIPFLDILSYHSGGVLLHGWPHIVFEVVLGICGEGTSFILWGSLCSILLFKGVIPCAPLEKFRGAALYLLLLLLALNAQGVTGFPGKRLLDLCLFAPGICLVLLLSLQRGKSFSFAVLNNPFMRKIGILSYSIYIWQQLFTAHQPWARSFKWGDSGWFNLPALAIVASMSYYLFEKKFLVFKDRWFKPKQRPVSETPLPDTHLAPI
jgi:peptidoglycan/LPS O-acetylase OafA/YrhL